MRLLLFDIDGTLLRVNGAGAVAIRRAVASITGRAATTDGVSFSGRTDPGIFRDVLRANGLDVRDDLRDAVIAAYVEEAQRTIHEGTVDRLPGSAALLSLLAAREDVFLGLVTGNVRPVALHKLETVGLAKYFTVGAFGSDHATRSKLPGLAARRARDQYGHSFSMADTLVVGDTRHDVHCARDAGAYAAAVSTGRPAHRELSALAPDLLFDTFDPPEPVVEEMLAVFADEPPPTKSGTIFK